MNPYNAVEHDIYKRSTIKKKNPTINCYFKSIEYQDDNEAGN